MKLAILDRDGLLNALGDDYITSADDWVPVPGALEAIGDDAVSDARYLDVHPLPGGGYRIWYEAPLSDLSHELRTELIPG